ncbi:MAG: HIT domain-containing protein [Pseudolabrys sp.]
MTESTWTLNSTLARDSAPVGDLPLSRALLNEDANYPWLILVPRRPALVELIDLDQRARTQLMGEIALASEALKQITQCDKLNVAALGNSVAQLHVHVIARFHRDAAWPNPVWNVLPRRAYQHAARDTLIAAIRNGLQIRPVQG